MEILKDYSDQKGFGKIGLTTLQERRMRVDIMKTFPKTYGNSVYGKKMFNASP